MIFTLVRISGFKQKDGSYIYESSINETYHSVLWSSRFESEAEMIRTMNGILTRQREGSDVRNVLDAIKRNEHQFFDLDLTEAEATSLGWKSHEQK
jgi:hypothetical protein